MVALVGPTPAVGSGRSGAAWDVFSILVAGWVCLGAWRYFLKHRSEAQAGLAKLALLFVTLVCAFMIAAGVWALLR